MKFFRGFFLAFLAQNYFPTMIIILSPSKTLRTEKIEHPAPTPPVFPEMTGKLMRKLSRLSKPELQKLMDISDKLTELNYRRFQNFDPEFESNSGEPAIYTYQGDVFVGLDAPSWSADELEYAESRLVILSGLYGILHPSTRVQPYRLEMGAPLKFGRRNLYKFWGDTLTSYVKTILQKQSDKILLNLASQEYSDALDFSELGGTIIDVHFREWRNDQWKFISFNSKKARGTMARYVIQNQIENREDLQKFDLDGYAFNDELSTELELFFTK